VVDRRGKPGGLIAEGVDLARLVLVEVPALKPPEETPLLSQEAEERGCGMALFLGVEETLTPLDGVAKSPKITLVQGGEA